MDENTLAVLPLFADPRARHPRRHGELRWTFGEPQCLNEAGQAFKFYSERNVYM